MNDVSISLKVSLPLINSQCSMKEHRRLVWHDIYCKLLTEEGGRDGEDIKGVYGLYNSHELNYGVVDGKSEVILLRWHLFFLICVCVCVCNEEDPCRDLMVVVSSKELMFPALPPGWHNRSHPSWERPTSITAKTPMPTPATSCSEVIIHWSETAEVSPCGGSAYKHTRNYVAVSGCQLWDSVRPAFCECVSLTSHDAKKTNEAQSNQAQRLKTASH